MPIFQDEDDDHLLGRGPATKPTESSLGVASSEQHIISGKGGASEESIRPELCEGPVYHVPGNTTVKMQQTGSDASQRTADRDFVEKLKRGESPNLVSNMCIDSLLQDGKHHVPKTAPVNSWPSLPSANFQKGARNSSHTDTEHCHTSSEIERPRSALHSGDFTEEGGSRREKEGARDSIDKSYVSTPSWMATSPPRDFTPFQPDLRFPHVPCATNGFERRARGRSLSSSFSSSFVLKAPTSPLVQFESNEDLDYGPPMDVLDIGAGLDEKSRRHTLQASHSPSSVHASLNFSRPLPNLRRDNTLPYQAHQPRSSLASNPTFYDYSTFPSPTPSWRLRRPSCTSETSPLQLAPMVGSYEESILRGRMSTTPSKPLDFVAKIGVLGRGKCKPYLRCPAHVTLPFPAVFYSYGTTSHGRIADSEDGPSPYVGRIDLENGIKPKERKRRKKFRADTHELDDHEMAGPPKEDLEFPENTERKKSDPQAPAGGSYRIPEKGQLQIIIKNPNNTAIKLFLVPYDLAGMVSGTKTFIRQRIHSAGPIIDAPVASTPPTLQPPAGRPILRYLIHVHICCPSKNRFYLYKTIRVVFANRVLDANETLQSEIQLPEPRFSPWKPARECLGFNSSALGSGAAEILVVEKASRRRSSGFALMTSTNSGTLQHGGFDAHHKTQAEREGVSEKAIPLPYPHALGSFSPDTPVTPIPFALDFRREAIAPSAISSQINSDPAMKDSEIRVPSSRLSSSNLQNSFGNAAECGNDDEKRNAIGNSTSAYDKLSKVDYGHGGQEGLLAKRLRNLGITRDAASKISSRISEDAASEATGAEP